ncbi:MAG: hypothetical protein M4579_006036 [Chaenotheca gracillima]|nr:MAG: hypothetical protein M4579_006036 [Chaenotheca gracillima]
MSHNVSDIVVSLVALHPRIQESTDTRPPVYKAVGISLAVASGVFIGISFVLKKKGLLKANVKYNEEAGEGYGYLKNAFWWTGMTLMIIGEICNFVAYAFVDAILVTPLGALSVVITTILSAIFLKERLSFIGKIGCFLCIVGSVVIVLNAPEQSSAGTIQDMQHFVIAPGFLTYAGVVIVGCAFVAFWAGPRYGKQSMLVYLTVCSLIGGLSVVATQGLGAAVVTQISGTPQFNQWFLYVLLVFVIATLVTEIIYLNKALNIYNAALVTPTYYVYFTSATIVTSAILFQGFKGTAASITTVVMGFLQICSGVVLLQLSKSAKDVPDAAIFAGDLDQVRTVAEQEQPESEPKADAIRGTAALIRRISQSRQKMEVEEAKRIHEDHLRDLEPIREGEQFEWDGLRRRRTTVGSRSSGQGSLHRRKTLHPPLGLTRFPDEEDNETQHRRLAGEDVDDDDNDNADEGFLGNMRRKASSVWVHHRSQDPSGRGLHSADGHSPMHPVPLTEIAPLPSYHSHEDTSYDRSRADSGAASLRPPGTPIRWADDVGQAPTRPRLGTPTSTTGSAAGPTPPPHSAKRQFSFQNVFNRHASHKDPATSHQDSHHGSGKLDTIRAGLGSRGSTATKGATEEERLGLVQGDSKTDESYLMEQRSRGGRDASPSSTDDEDWQIESKPRVLSGSSSSSDEADRKKAQEEKEMEAYVENRRRWRESTTAAQVSPGGSMSPPRIGTAGPGPGPGPGPGTRPGRRRGDGLNNNDDDDYDPDDADDPARGGGSSKGPATGHAFL